MWLDKLVAVHDRRPIQIKCVIWSLIVFIIGIGIDLVLDRSGIPRPIDRVAANATEGVLVGAVVYIVLKKRDQRLQRRFQEIGYLNHHINNALTVIENLDVLVAEAEEKARIAKEASARIKRCLRKVSRSEDLTDIDRTPGSVN